MIPPKGAVIKYVVPNADRFAGKIFATWDSQKVGQYNKLGTPKEILQLMAPCFVADDG